MERIHVRWGAWVALAVSCLVSWGLAFAADGGACASYTGVAIGDYRDSCVYLCDAKGSGDSTCPEVDISAGLGWPHHYVIKVNAKTGCSGNPQVTPIGRHVTGGTAEDLVITALDWDTKRSQDFRVPTHKFVAANLGTMTACTDLEVFLVSYHSRN